jgi:hypothetical protein
VPALSVGQNRTEDSFEFLVGAGLSSEELREINERQWIYSVPTPAVGRRIAELGDEDVLLESHGPRGTFYLYASGRIDKMPD